MSNSVFVIILFAAVLHASWNAIVKAGNDKQLTTVLVTASSAISAILLLPFVEPPKIESWPFIAASAALQVIYFTLVARIYRVADMSQSYPVMRGAAPLVVALAGTVALDEFLSLNAWFGVTIICFGILIMMYPYRRGNQKGVNLALLNAMVIAGYTLVDAVGVRRSAAPASYTLWIFLLTGTLITLWASATRLADTRRYLRSNWHLGVIGGLGTFASYGLALYAMTLAPVALVAALRETSILFAAAISWWLLKESVGHARIVSACMIATGAIMLRLS